MKARIEFEVESEEEFDRLVDASIIEGETWELYDDRDDIIKFTDHESYNKSKK